MTCFCISSNYHLLRPSREQRSVPDENLQVMLSWMIQAEVVWMSPGITEITDIHSQDSKHKSNIFLSSQLFFYEGYFSAICTKHRTVFPSKLEFALFGVLRPFHGLFRKKTLQD